MNDIDWTKPATLIERDDGGSDMYFDFKEIGRGPFAELINQVCAMPPGERARVVIDAGSLGTFNVGQIAELARRDDFPG